VSCWSLARLSWTFFKILSPSTRNMLYTYRRKPIDKNIFLSMSLHELSWTLQNFCSCTINLEIILSVLMLCWILIHVLKLH
jgi:hypothetical protein